MTEKIFNLIGEAIAQGFGSLISEEDRNEYWAIVGRKHREYNERQRLRSK